MTAPTNREQGNIFERLFFKQAQRNGLLVIPNYLTCRFVYKGRVQVIKGELDFKLINQSGKVGFFDCKTYQGNFFVFSDLEENQVKRAILYNHYSVPSGFIVWFREINQIVFYSGHSIARKGPGSRFEPEDGSFLGSFSNFDLKPLLAV